MSNERDNDERLGTFFEILMLVLISGLVILGIICCINGMFNFGGK